MPATKRRHLFWTLGNLMLIGGLYLLLYVGGLYAQADYQRMAARGDSDIDAPRTLMGAPPAALSSDTLSVAPHTAAERPAADLPAFQAPVLNSEGQIVSAPPSATMAAHSSSVERIVIPSIKLDSKVIEVGWQLEAQGGQQVAVWQVAEYAVGQHQGSANPGEGGNVVLAGHAGGFGKVFRDLYYVHPGEPIIVYSAGRQFRYTVQERVIVTETGATQEQRAANAQLIAPSDHELITLVTCWPLTGPDRYTQRVIIRAMPFDPAPAPGGSVAAQTIR